MEDEELKEILKELKETINFLLAEIEKKQEEKEEWHAEAIRLAGELKLANYYIQQLMPQQQKVLKKNKIGF